jgi:hypothetical protein
MQKVQPFNPGQLTPENSLKPVIVRQSLLFFVNKREYIVKTIFCVCPVLGQRLILFACGGKSESVKMRGEQRLGTRRLSITAAGDRTVGWTRRHAAPHADSQSGAQEFVGRQLAKFV